MFDLSSSSSNIILKSNPILHIKQNCISRIYVHPNIPDGHSSGCYYLTSKHVQVGHFTRKVCHIMSFSV